MKSAILIVISIAIMLFLSLNVFSAQVNSTSYKQNVVISSGGDSLTSSTYKTGVAVSIINMIINSTSFFTTKSEHSLLSSSISIFTGLPLPCDGEFSDRSNLTSYFSFFLSITIFMRSSVLSTTSFKYASVL